METGSEILFFFPLLCLETAIAVRFMIILTIYYITHTSVKVWGSIRKGFSLALQTQLKSNLMQLGKIKNPVKEIPSNTFASKNK